MIIGNKFKTQGNPILYAKSTGGLLFKNNEVKLVWKHHGNAPHTLFILNGCKDAIIKQNSLPPNYTTSGSICLYNIRNSNYNKIEK